MSDDKSLYQEEEKKGYSMKKYLIKQSLDLSRAMNLHIKEYE